MSFVSLLLTLALMPAKDSVLNVINGTAQYGVGSSSLLLERNAGKPVVALAVISQIKLCNAVRK
jgi:hypothetical protein